MIEQDRALLARVARVNTHLGTVVVELVAGQDGGELPAAGLRELGQRLADLGADLLARAGERAAPMIIDAGPDRGLPTGVSRHMCTEHHHEGNPDGRHCER